MRAGLGFTSPLKRERERAVRSPKVPRVGTVRSAAHDHERGDPGRTPPSYRRHGQSLGPPPFQRKTRLLKSKVDRRSGPQTTPTGTVPSRSAYHPPGTCTASPAPEAPSAGPPSRGTGSDPSPPPLSAVEIRPPPTAPTTQGTSSGRRPGRTSYPLSSTSGSPSAAPSTSSSVPSTSSGSRARGGTRVRVASGRNTPTSWRPPSSGPSRQGPTSAPAVCDEPLCVRFRAVERWASDNERWAGGPRCTCDGCHRRWRRVVTRDGAAVSGTVSGRHRATCVRDDQWTPGHPARQYRSRQGISSSHIAMLQGPVPSAHPCPPFPPRAVGPGPSGARGRGSRGCAPGPDQV